MRAAALTLLLSGCLSFSDSGAYKCTGAADSSCSADCVCAVFTLGSGENLDDVWGSSANDVWAVGKLNDGSQALHFDGKQWVRKDLPLTGVELFGVWGTSAADVWAAGDNGTLIHFDGTQWSAAASPTQQQLQALSGTSSKDVWAVGYFEANHQNLLHYDGSSWTLLNGGPSGLYGVAAFAADDVWAAGVEWGAAYHYDGSQWHDVPMPNLQTVHGMFGRNATDFWVAAGQGLAHSDGQGFDTRLHSDSELRDVWADEPTDVWVAGDSGQLWRGDGNTFHSLNSGITSNLRGVWGSGPGDVFAVGAGGVVRFHP